MQESRNNVYRPEFDISNDNRNIICSYYENNKASIFQVNVTNNQQTKVSPSTDYSLIKPLFSPDNKKIGCIAETLNDENKSKICLIDIKSNALIDLTNDTLLILEFVFDPSGESIYFTAAGHFGSYSPVARKAPHEIEIYHLDIGGKYIRKLTDFDSYDLHGLSINNRGDSLLFNLTSKINKGLFWMDIKSKKLFQITASNDLRAEQKASPYEYYTPVLSRDNNKITFSEPYELYIMDRQTGNTKLIFRNESYLVNVGDTKFFYSYNYLMISLPSKSKIHNSSGENYSFYTLNPETNELKSLDL
jgi:Tol biopolymer transport system component